MRIVTALFKADEAAATVHKLIDSGFNRDDLSLMSSTTDIPDYLESEPEEAAVDGAAVGAVTGGTVGALGAWASSTIPGFESMFVAGALTTTIGAVVGGYLGSLYNVRADSKTEIDIDEELAAGKVLLVVKTDEGEMETAVSILSQNNGQHVETHTISDSDQ